MVSAFRRYISHRQKVDSLRFDIFLEKVNKLCGTKYGE